MYRSTVSYVELHTSSTLSLHRVWIWPPCSFSRFGNGSADVISVSGSARIRVLVNPLQMRALVSTFDDVKPIRKRAAALLSAHFLGFVPLPSSGCFTTSQTPSPIYWVLEIGEILPQTRQIVVLVVAMRIGTWYVLLPGSVLRRTSRATQFPAPIFASSTPFFFGNGTEIGPLPGTGALQVGVESATEQVSSPAGLFSPLPDFLQQPSGTSTPVPFASQYTSTSAPEFTQPFTVDAEDTEIPPPCDALILDWLTRYLQHPLPTEPDATLSDLHGQTSFMQAPFYQFDSPLNNGVYVPSTPGPSAATSSSPSSTGPSDSEPYSPDSQLMYPSPEPVEGRGDLLVADNEGHGDHTPLQSQAGPVRQPKAQPARDPLYSSGKYKCRHHGCPWRFRNARMCYRHEQTHNEANAYFCCNPQCATNTGKRKAGFPRRDSIRRHYIKKSPDDPCVVMARNLGWTGQVIYEEEMFRFQPAPTF